MQGHREPGRAAPRPAAVPPFWFSNRKGWSAMSFRTDRDLANLPSDMIVLALGSTKVTDAGLVHLKRFTRLELLDLSDTKVTDSGLVHLKGLTGLIELDLGKTRIT